jgi:hypothetical protein
MEDSIKLKNDRYDAIKEGERTLRSMTEKIEEVMSKTRAEIRISTENLSAKDLLTAENLMNVVKEHSEKVLFPRSADTYISLDHHDAVSISPSHMETFKKDMIVFVSFI